MNKRNIKAWGYFRLKVVCLIICSLDKDSGSVLTCFRFTAFGLIQQFVDSTSTTFRRMLGVCSECASCVVNCGHFGCHAIFSIAIFNNLVPRVSPLHVSGSEREGRPWERGCTFRGLGVTNRQIPNIIYYSVKTSN